MGEDEADSLVRGLAGDHRAAPLEGPDRLVVDYAAKLARSPEAVGAADVQRLRDAGLDDRAIHDLCAIAAYYAFVNRIAAGLGVELEPRFSDAPGA